MIKRNAVYFMWGPGLIPRGFIDFWNTGWAGKKAAQHTLPIRIFSCLDARPAPQGCPAFWTGLRNVFYMDIKKE